VVLVVAGPGTCGAAVSAFGCLDGDECAAAHARKLTFGVVVCAAAVLAWLLGSAFDRIAERDFDPDRD
jgi:hypothetical protein